MTSITDEYTLKIYGSKQTCNIQIRHGEILSKKLCEVKGKGKVSNRFATLGNLDDDINRGWETNIENGVLWDVTPCGSCKNRRFGGI
jgi:hypothetical protein